MSGPTLAVEADDVRMAVVGAEAAIDILADVAAASGRRMAGMQSFRLRRGEAIRIGALSRGAVLYVAVEGGFDIAPVLGSVSTCIRGGFGGWQGRALVAGDQLPLCRDAGERARGGQARRVSTSRRPRGSAPSSGRRATISRSATSRRSSTANTPSAPAPTAWACA